MIPNPDWDPIQALQDLTDNLERQNRFSVAIAQEIVGLSQTVSVQHRLIMDLNSRLRELEAEIEDSHT